MENWNLIAKHLSGNASVEENDLLQEWIKLAPENEILFKEAKAIWNGSANVYEENDFDTRAEWEKLKERIDGSESTKKGGIVRRLNLLKVAAVVIIVIVSGVFIKMYFSEDESLAVAQLEYAQEITSDSVRVVYLPDSSTVVLNENSIITYAKNFADTARIVYLVGEAYFEVTKSGKYFIVYAGGTQITVLGTSFNINAREEDDEVEIVVVEGKVSFSDQENLTDTTRLEAGEKVSFRKTEHKFTKNKSSDADLWWKSLDIEDRARSVIRKLKNN